MIVNDRHSGIHDRSCFDALWLSGRAKLVGERSQPSRPVEIDSAILAAIARGMLERIVLTVAARGNGERADSLFGYGINRQERFNAERHAHTRARLVGDAAASLRVYLDEK
jgi:ribosomal 50S subunit-recycling heat shock protein